MAVALGSLRRVRPCPLSGGRRRLLFEVPSGVLAVYKPKDWTSTDVVQKVRSTLERERRHRGEKVKGKAKRIKVGHGGTLDPTATGVLVLGIGAGTRRLEAYLAGSKRYEATALLGSETDSLDATGEVVATKEWRHVTRGALLEAAAAFTGDIEQVPPMYSALRKDGKRLYELARAGDVVARDPRPVRVAALDVTSVDLPSFTLDVECSGGTYVRSLIADIARHPSVDSLAHMTQLERTKQGPFTLDHCLPHDKWSSFTDIADHLRACADLLPLDQDGDEAPAPPQTAGDGPGFTSRRS